MSLLTRVSSIFTKSQPEQLIGIALQQNAVSLCSIPKSVEAETKRNNRDADAKVVFQQQALDSLDYSQTLSKLQSEQQLAGSVHIVLNNLQSQIVQVDKPSVPEGEILGALKWQVKDLVTIAPDNMVLDYYDTPIASLGKEKINVVCAPLSELKALVHSASQNNLKVETIITQEFAFANLLPNLDEACLLVCQQPNEEIVLLIVKQGQIYFFRRLRGFAHIANKTEEELATTIDGLSLEIQRSTDYFERQLKQAPIKEIKVLLPITLEAFLARKLSENTNVPVTLLELPSPYHEHREFAASLGATYAVSTADKEG